MISMRNVQTSSNVRRIMMKMMEARLMTADIREVRMTILLIGRHWPLHLILIGIFITDYCKLFL